MKQKRILLFASMALLMFGCKAQNAGSEQAAVIPAPAVTETAAVEKPSAQRLLESKLKKDMPYADLRKIVLADGWSPLKTEACKENVGGEAEICDRQPEVEACSGDGHCNMYFISGDGGTKLRVGTNNDSVRFWEFSSQDSSNTEKRHTWDMPLSKEACTEKGYWSFFEAFVKSDAIKKSHTSSGVQIFDYSSNKKVTDKFSRFKIGLVDNLWVYLDSGKSAGDYHRVSVKDSFSGNSFRVDYQKAQLGGDEELVKTIGEPGAYVFEMQNGCWQLTQEYR